jgi:hypothetical protein
LQHFINKDLQLFDLQQRAAIQIRVELRIINIRLIIQNFKNKYIMSEHKFFINRRKGLDRRLDIDPCKHLPIDIYHRKRRKTIERRHGIGNVQDDYSGFFNNTDSRGHTMH